MLMLSGDGRRPTGSFPGSRGSQDTSSTCATASPPVRRRSVKDGEAAMSATSSSAALRLFAPSCTAAHRINPNSGRHVIMTGVQIRGEGKGRCEEHQVSPGSGAQFIPGVQI